MSLPSALQALGEHWDDVSGYLQPGDAEFIATALRRIAAEPQEAGTWAADIVQILVERLPAGNPVLELIFAQQRLATVDGPATASAQWAAALGALSGIPDLDLGKDGRPGANAGNSSSPPSPGTSPDAGQGALSQRGQEDQAGPGPDAWVLAAPALTEEQVRARGADPGRDDLIRLATGTGQVTLPAFQFGPSGTPIPVVTAVNRLLAAADDPWGVADWWLGRNAWLGGIPARLLGRVDDETLLRAAAAEFPGG